MGYMNDEKSLPQIKIEEIAKKGEEIYQKKLKLKYEPSHNGKFLAIEIESEEEFLGDTSVEAVEKAKAKYPKKLFYIKKISFPATEAISSRLPPQHSYGRLF